MNRKILYFLAVLNGFLFFSTNAQVAAPDLRCIAVTSPTSTVLSWIIPPDPSNLFSQYQIWASPVQTGPFVMIGTVNSYTQSSYTQIPTNADLQSQYYYVTTVSGTNTSLPSDTLRSIFVSFSNPNGVVSLNWNSIHAPLLPSSSTTYTLSREAPPGTWTTIYSGTKQNYKDTIMICKVYYNYKVEISDNSGCTSVSNTPGDTCYNIQAPNILVLDSVSVNSNGETTIGWLPSSSTDVTAYIIYESEGGFLTAVDTIYGYNNTSFTYTSTSASAGSEGFCVAAADSCGKYSIPSLTHRTMFLKTTYDLCSRTASLTWTTYSNLTKGVLRYDIYCSINGATSVLLGTTTGSSYNHSALTPGSTYCYTIRVWNTDQSISASSNVSCLTANGLPGPSYVYVNSVSVNTSSKQIEVKFSVDNTNPYKGSNIYKSEDGINFTKVGFMAFSTVTPMSYTDIDVSSTEKNYFYKIEVADNCDNPGVVSNISKSIVLQVSNDNENIFYNTLTWDYYTSWSGSVSSYNIYRAVNGVFDSAPIDNVASSARTYVDNVQDFVSAEGKFSYYVEAVEGSGNIYGFMDIARSNPADAYVEVNVFVPNAFAPKGQNDVWLPIAQYVEKTDYKVMVFNRWGDKVFETHSDVEGWTGDAATDEVYVYLIEYKNARGEYIQLKGHLTVIR
ncbi:MAG: gliding motility-associated C-terminal domain-containing protein [Bacteroidota bacterium]